MINNYLPYNTNKLFNLLESKWYWNFCKRFNPRWYIWRISIVI